MSNSIGLEDKSASQNESVAERTSHSGAARSIVEQANEENEVRAEAQKDDVFVESVTPAPQEPQDGEHVVIPGGGTMTDEVGRREDGESSETSKTEGIESEASEHLARRAAEMSLGTDNEGHTIDDKHGLPASPPAPPVPEKDIPKPLGPAPEIEYDEKHPPPVEESHSDIPDAPQGTAEATGAEIQNIMDQFQNGTGGPGEREIMSPRLEKQQPVLVLPPRTSSLENRDQPPMSPQSTGGSISGQPFSPVDVGKAQSMSGGSLHRTRTDDNESIISARPSSIFQPPPPSPDPEPALPFDFHRFLEQLRHRTADPVARYLRSFLNEFGKKQWMVHEQVKLISDFLEFIAKRMVQCEVWRTVSAVEFDNAKEGMEKLVMNRLYSQTFSPAISPVAGSPRKTGQGGRSPADMANPHGPGRRGQHQEDVERDEVIAQKLRIYGWIQEQHLDIKPINEKGKKFLALAQQELLKINTYRAPRDKVICVLNCCKVIFGFLRNSRGDQSADAFVPLLIYTVLRARPEHVVSNVQYVWRFRNQDKLGGESGYYMSSLMGVVTFIENLDRTNLTITDEEFEDNVEQAVSAIAEENKADEYEEKSHLTAGPAGPMQRLNEKSALSRPEVTPRNSMEAEQSSPRRNAGREKSQLSSSDSDSDFDAVTGLLRTIQKPLSSIGRIFSDNDTTTRNDALRPASTPLPGSSPRNLSPAPGVPRRPSGDGRGPNTAPTDTQNAATEAAARQASAEAAQAQRVRAKEYKVVVETLQSMFPNLDKEVIEDVVRAQEGNVGRAVDACLALSG